MPKHYLSAANLTVGSSTANALKQAVQTDLEAQKKAAEFALEQAQKIETTLRSSTNHDPQLIDAKDALLKVAQLLAANTTATSTAVLEIVSTGQSSKP